MVLQRELILGLLPLLLYAAVPNGLTARAYPRLTATLLLLTPRLSLSFMLMVVLTTSASNASSALLFSALMKPQAHLPLKLFLLPLYLHALNLRWWSYCDIVIDLRPRLSSFSKASISLTACRVHALMGSLYTPSCLASLLSFV